MCIRDRSITAQTCFARNFWASGIVNYDSNSLVIRSTEQGGGWKKATIVFTAEPSSCLLYTSYRAFIGIGMTVNTAEGKKRHKGIGGVKHLSLIHIYGKTDI